jgi:hypothetical protein
MRNPKALKAVIAFLPPPSLLFDNAQVKSLVPAPTRLVLFFNAL